MTDTGGPIWSGGPASLAGRPPHGDLADAPTPVPAAAAQPAIIFVAPKLSKARWLVGIHAPVADKISRHSVAGGDSRALLELIARTRRRTEQQLGRPATVVCCYEAGYDGFWLHRLLCAGGIASHVFGPASLPVDRRARRAKPDPGSTWASCCAR